MTDGKNPTNTLEYVLDRVFDTFDVVIAKFTSGKFVATVLIVWTYCHVINTASSLVEGGKIGTETYIALISGLAATAALVVKDYFAKDEKKGEQNA